MPTQTFSQFLAASDVLPTCVHILHLQPVFSYLRCIAYMCAYFTKSEIEFSLAILAAAKKAHEYELDLKASLKR